MADNSIVMKLLDGQMQGMEIAGLPGNRKAIEKMDTNFSKFLNQGIQISKEDNVSSDIVKSQKEANSYEGSNNSYERYQYKKNQIEQVDDKANPILDKIDSAQGELENFEKNLVSLVCEKFDVSEEELINVMQMLGITVYDLLNPQNLTQLTIELTGITDASTLLLDENFQSLLADITTMGNELMAELGMNSEEMQQLISMMDVLESPQTLENLAENFDFVQTSEVVSEETIAKQTEIASSIGAQENNVVNQRKNTEGEPVEKESVDEKDIMPAQDEKLVISDKRELSSGQEELDSNQDANEEGQMQGKIEGKLEGDKTFSVEHLEKENANANVSDFSIHSGIENVPQEAVVNNVSGSEQYISINTIDILQQLAENVRVSNLTDVSSIEMQLNPENLGKLYVNISSKEGAVSAQIAATNEAVKEALEAQVIELRETLNQSGVKVDAIEVTVASHEFERNLEQGQSREEQEAERQEESVTKLRRNIDISSVDELTGIMSEEEALIAQIMKDNGNSLDYSV